jgi:TetR/AcrR family transcriptional regulator, transcriptional repressor for nem operon
LRKQFRHHQSGLQILGMLNDGRHIAVKWQYDDHHRTGAKRVSAASIRRVETRQRILSAAARLFRQHGVDGIGVDAVMREAGLTHGGFYLHFPSKDALAAEVSRSLLEDAAQRWEAVVNATDRSGALKEIVSRYLDSERVASGSTCVLTTLCTDVARRPAAREGIGAPLRSMLQSLEKCMGDAEPRASFRALSQLVGAVVLARVADDPALAEAFLDAAEASLVPENAMPNGEDKAGSL